MFSFKPRSVSSILAGFAATLAELDAHNVERLQLAADRYEAAKVANAEAEAHEVEASAAASVAAKLRALIG